MRRLLGLGMVLLLTTAAYGVRQRAYGYCQNGGQRVTVNGITSSSYVQQSYPGCTVTVYISGTLTLAALSSNNSGSIALANPFTASSSNGSWFFYAVDNRYDIQLTGGGLTSTVTLADVMLNGTGGGGTAITLQTNSIVNPTQNLLNLVAGANMTLTDDGVGNISFAASGGGGGGGVLDPGANGVMKRTSLNVTAPAVAADVVSLWSGCASSPTEYLAGNGTCQTASLGDAKLTPSTDQIFQAAAATVANHFRCPVGAAADFTAYDFQAADGTNIMAFQCGKTVVFADGISGHWLASYFATSVGVPADTGVFRLANTQSIGWRNAAGTGNCTITVDNTDLMTIAGCSGFKLGTSFVPSTTATTIGRGMVANDLVGGLYSSNGTIYADAPAYADGGGDFCKTLNNAITAAVTLKQNVDARGLGVGTQVACITPPMADTYDGTVYLPDAMIFLRSNAAMFMAHSRVHWVGAREGRSLSGPTSGTMLIACNAADGTAIQSAACSGTTYNPTAGNLCTDGDGTTVPCAMMSWSLNANPGLPATQMFATTIENLTVNCNGVSGCIGIQGGMFPITHAPLPVCSGKCGPQENGWIKGVRVENFGNAGTGIKLMPGTSNFQVDSINALNEGLVIADCSASHAINVVFDSTVNANGPKQVSNITNTNGGCTIKPVDSMLLDAGQVRVMGYHTENTTGSGIYVGSQADAMGVTLINVNGVGSGASSAVVHIESGHSVGLTAISTFNVNPAGYTILDDVHGTGIRIDCQSSTAFYAFGIGVADPVQTDAPCIPKVFTTGPPFITNVALTAGDVVRLVGSSTSYQITKNGNTTSRLIPLGITLAAIADTAVRVPVATYGVVGVGGIPGPIVDTAGACLEGDFVYYGTTTTGKVLCSTTRPPNIGILGIALNTAVATETLPMFINPEPPMQPVITQCSGTGTAANPSVVSCVATNSGLNKCAHAASAGTCQINTTAVKATSIILLQLDQSITTGCDATYALPLQVSARNVGVSFTLPVGTLGGTDGLCLAWTIQNIE